MNNCQLFTMLYNIFLAAHLIKPDDKTIIIIFWINLIFAILSSELFAAFLKGLLS